MAEETQVQRVKFARPFQRGNLIQPHDALFSSCVVWYLQRERSRAHSDSVGRLPYAVELPLPLLRAPSPDPGRVLRAQKLRKRMAVGRDHSVPSGPPYE